MKKYTLIALCVASFFTTACDKSLDKNVDLHVSVASKENVSYDGQIITVKKGTPVEFLLSGDPNFLTFFSGETGQKYQYRQRKVLDPTLVKTSKLNFNLWFLYGNPALVNKHVYISEEFPGLAKDNFEADSIQVEQHLKDGKWKDMIEQKDFPTKASSSVSSYIPTPFSLDVTSYVGKRISIAIYYEGIGNTAIQSGLSFGQMHVNNLTQSGESVRYSAGSFGFTPLNMKHKANFPDQTGMTQNRAYATVLDNKVAGAWNLAKISLGEGGFNNSAQGARLKYSWLISDPIIVNSCTPDQGTQIKNISQRLDTYSYTYQQVGIYNATFLANNVNMDHASTTVSHMVINVVE